MAVPRLCYLQNRDRQEAVFDPQWDEVRLAASPTRTYISFIPKHNTRIGGCCAPGWNIGRKRRHNQ